MHLNTAPLASPGGLPAFAHANGLTYEATAKPPALGPSLWEQVSNGTVRNKITGNGWEAGHITGGNNTASRTEQVGRWKVTTSASVNAPTRSINLGYLAITLPRRLPHMLLDARSNARGLSSSLLNTPREGQHLALEGDFDTHFRLYVPAGYERDALYVFTPDFMALLIDESGDLDVEIRDDRLIVYKPGGFALTDPATWQRFAHILDTIGAKAWDRTDMYIDDRADAPALDFAGPSTREVAASGRRLRRGLPPGAWLGIGVVVAVVAIFGTVTAILLPLFS